MGFRIKRKIVNMASEREKLRRVVSELLPGGGTRAVLITGSAKDTDRARNELSKALTGSPPLYLWVEIDGVINDSPETWIANFARSIKGGRKVDSRMLGEFARRIGKMLAISKNQPAGNFIEKDNSSPDTLEDKFVRNFEELVAVISESNEGSKIVPALCFSNLSSFAPNMLNWMSRALNTALRKSKSFRHSRFVFTDSKESPACTRFFSSFGFEKVKRLKVLPNQSQKSQTQVAENQTKELKKIMNSPKLSTSMQDQNQKSLNPNKELDFSSFPEKHQEYILLACLPHFINRDTLEYFCSPTEAAYCYNWLLRTHNLVQPAHENFFVLNPSIKKSAREALRNKDPKAEHKETLASVLDKFMEYFPSPDLHWVPVNLQLFSTFSRELLKKLFDDDRFEIIDNFLADNEDAFSKDQKLLTLQEEPRLITKRLLELTDLEPLEGLSDKISAQWEEDQLLYDSQKKSLESERLAMQQEIEEIKGQISHFSQMRDQLIENSSNPNAYRPKKNFTFSLSLPLVVIGLTTIGASLFSDSIGSYHAACGLFLTFIGFFWPSVEIQKPEFQTAGGKPKLAVETQQRSFNHRISGLVNRASSLKESLTTVNDNLDSLNTGAQTPYLSS